MQIYDEHQKLVGELERPEPVKQDGQWWEATEYRKSKKGENYYDEYTEEMLCDEEDSRCTYWIMQPIPRATPEQLKAIGMRELHSRPTRCGNGITQNIWDGKTALYISDNERYREHLGYYRWVLVPVEKEVMRMSCEDCTHRRLGGYCDLRLNNNGNCKSYIPISTPAPLRNEKELCYECENRLECYDYIEGRTMACSDFGFVKEQSIPTPIPQSVSLPDCFFCHKPQTRPGGLLFGPSNDEGRCRKIHCCVECWPWINPKQQPVTQDSDYKAVPEMRGNEQIGVTFERKVTAQNVMRILEDNELASDVVQEYACGNEGILRHGLNAYRDAVREMINKEAK